MLLCNDGGNLKIFKVLLLIMILLALPVSWSVGQDVQFYELPAIEGVTIITDTTRYIPK